MPVVKRLMESLEEIKELHRRKNDDYASSDNPFSNFDVSTYLLGIFTNPRDQSFIWPIATKLARLSTLLNSGNTPNNESIHDSLLDIATYTLLWDADIANRGNLIKNNVIKDNQVFTNCIAQSNTTESICIICNKKSKQNMLSLTGPTFIYEFCGYFCLNEYLNKIE